MKEFTGYRKGINLGGWFSQCDHSEKRYDYFIREADFERISRWGFDHVRLPVDYELILDEDFRFLEKGFDRIADCISWAQKNGLNMILDLHKTPGFSFDAGENEDGFFLSQRYQEIFYGIWEEFAKRFGENENLSFELLNEVTDESYCDKWNQIAAKTVRVIRTYAPDIHILIGGYHNNSVRAIKDLDLPYDDRIVYSFHCYAPLVFTHQGAYWIDRMDRTFRTPFRRRYSEYRKLTEEYAYPGFDDGFPENDEEIDASYFDSLLKEAIEVAEKRNVPLYCGEFGVIDLADQKDTLDWFSCICSVFDQYRIGRAVWSYKEMDFGIIDAHYDKIRNELIEMI